MSNIPRKDVKILHLLNLFYKPSVYQVSFLPQALYYCPGSVLHEPLFKDKPVTIVSTPNPTVPFSMFPLLCPTIPCLLLHTLFFILVHLHTNIHRVLRTSFCFLGDGAVPTHTSLHIIFFFISYAVEYIHIS